ncbi:MAG TPA: cytochrome c oxidase subunit 3 [Terriglobia bacterium]|nr:cytochrome c oxidase subunit 3 [Terriglobia bacterium]
MDAEAQTRFESWDNNKLAMTLFLLSEGTFFVFLIIAYVYYHSLSNTGVEAAKVLDPLKTGIYTIFLLSSSFTVWQSEKSLRRGKQRAFQTWLLVTIVLGAIFLFGQGSEYLHLYGENVTISRNIFGTSFFTLTGFHGLHVLLGLISLAVIFVLALTGEFAEKHSSAVEAIALYWHFVDWVWVVIFSVIYLWTLF